MAGIEFPSCSNEDSSEEGSTRDCSESCEEEYHMNPDSSNSLQEEAGAANNNAESVNDMNKVRIKLIENGAYKRLRDLMLVRLNETGWNLHMMTHCREYICKKGGKITHDVLYQALKETAYEEVPDAVKEELLQKLKYAYKSEVKEEQIKPEASTGSDDTADCLCDAQLKTNGCKT